MVFAAKASSTMSQHIVWSPRSPDTRPLGERSRVKILAAAETTKNRLTVVYTWWFIDLDGRRLFVDDDIGHVLLLLL